MALFNSSEFELQLCVVGENESENSNHATRFLLFQFEWKEAARIERLMIIALFKNGETTVSRRMVKDDAEKMPKPKHRKGVS